MSEKAPVIHIGGWPGAGKKTIGRIVADRLGGRLIDNHILLDAMRSVYDRGHPQGPILREELRVILLDHARRLPADTVLVLTDALVDEAAAGPLFQPTIELAQARGAALHCVLLDLDPEENARRLLDPGREGGAKLRDAVRLDEIRRNDTLFCPDGATTLDVTHLTAAQTATAVIDEIESRRNAGT